MALAEPVNLPVSQGFAGSYSGEPIGYLVYASSHPLKAYGSRFPGSSYRHDLHKAIDAYGAIGTPLGAMEAGTVSEVLTDGSGAKIIRVLIRGHANVRYSFTHCSSFLVTKGAKVTKGQPIAKLGRTGNVTGAHVHIMVEIKEKGSDGVTRWLAYDPARFSVAGTYKYGASYHNGAVLFGGDMIYDDRIYPTRPITINDGVNIRVKPSTDAAILHNTTVVTPANQINEIPGGGYEVSGVPGHLWAKVKVAISGAVATGYVAKPLIKV